MTNIITYSTVGRLLNDAGIIALPERNIDGNTIPVKHKHITRTNPPTIEELDLWDVKYKDCNVGIKGDVIGGLDIDVSDSRIVDGLLLFISARFPNNNIIYRTGTHPRVLIPFNNKNNLRMSKSMTYKTDKGLTAVVECLGVGFKFTYYGLHRKTNKPYTESSVFTTKTKNTRLVKCNFNKELPTLTGGDIRCIYQEFERLTSQYEEYDFSEHSTLNSLAKVKSNIDIHEEEGLMQALIAVGDVEYSNWVKIGMAFHDLYLGKPKGLDKWIQYSKAVNDEFEPFIQDEMSYKYTAFEHGKGITKDYLLTLIQDEDIESNNIDFIACNSLPEALSRFRLLRDGQIYDTASVGNAGFSINKEAFIQLYHNVQFECADGKTRTLPALWMASKRRKNLVGLLYDPTGDRIINNTTDSVTTSWGNSYYPAIIKETQDTNLLHYFIDHMKSLVNEEVEANWLIQWVAWLLRKPEQLSQVTPFSWCPNKGLGRGWFGCLLGKLLGSWNVAEKDIDDLMSDKNSFLFEKRLIIINEASKTKYPETLPEKLKNMTTMGHGELRKMYADCVPRKRTAVFLMFGNSIPNWGIDSNERRYNVLLGTGEKKSQAYNDRLYGLLDNPEFIRQVYTYIMNIRLDDFNFQTAIPTEGFRRIVKGQISPIVRQLADLIDSNKLKCLTVEDVVFYVSKVRREDESTVRKLRLNNITKYFADVHAVPIVNYKGVDCYLLGKYNSVDITTDNVELNEAIDEQLQITHSLIRRYKPKHIKFVNNIEGDVDFISEILGDDLGVRDLNIIENSSDTDWDI